MITKNQEMEVTQKPFLLLKMNLDVFGDYGADHAMISEGNIQNIIYEWAYVSIMKLPKQITRNLAMNDKYDSRNVTER